MGPFIVRGEEGERGVLFEAGIDVEVDEEGGDAIGRGGGAPGGGFRGGAAPRGGGGLGPTFALLLGTEGAVGDIFVPPPGGEVDGLGGGGEGANREFIDNPSGEPDGKAEGDFDR